MKDAPQYPILVIYYESGEAVEQETYDDEDDLVMDLEWFDSEHRPEEAAIFDRDGRRVRLKIEAMKVLICELAEPDPLAGSKPATNRCDPGGERRGRDRHK